VAAGFNEMHLTGSDVDLEDIEDDEPDGAARA
jgi:hypothetical protein